MAVSKPTYWDLLKSPEWQKKRLEIMQRDEWRCTQCGSTVNWLQVHHGYYQTGKKPWEYPDETLHTLCEDCHKETTEMMRKIYRLIGQMNTDLLGVMYGVVVGALAFAKPELKLSIDHEDSDIGVAAVIGVPVERVYQARTEEAGHYYIRGRDLLGPEEFESEITESDAPAEDQ